MRRRATITIINKPEIEYVSTNRDISMWWYSIHIYREFQESGITINKVELQKILFFTTGLYIRHNGIDTFIKELYQTPFMLWRYGPVHEKSYYFFDAVQHYKGDIDCRVYSELAKNAFTIQQYSFPELVKLTYSLPTLEKYKSNGEYRYTYYPLNNFLIDFCG